MKLSAVAAYFDRLPVLDAYSGASLGKAQLDLFDDTKRDGVTAIRRALSVKAGWVPPTRRVIALDGQPFIVGSRHFDTFGASAIRDKFVLHPADGLCSAFTGHDLLTTGATGQQLYAAKAWVKDVKDISTTSYLQSQYVAYAAMGEPVVQGNFLLMPGGSLLRVHNTYHSIAGYLAMECSELEPDALTSVQFTSQVQSYDPVLEVYGSPSITAVPAIVTRFLDDYEFRNEKMSDAYLGDLRVRLRAADVPGISNGDTISLRGRDWRVISVDSRPDSTWSVQVRPV